MSEVANKDLCAELRKVSGWSGIGSVLQYWVKDSMLDVGKRVDKRFEYKLANIMQIVDDYGPTAVLDADSFIPAYSLGYMLRKLPTTNDETELNITYSNSENEWQAGFSVWGEYSWSDGFSDEIPEDAVAMLCIELFKQGVLKKEVA